MKQMIQWDPNKRATAKNLLKHQIMVDLIYIMDLMKIS